MTDRPPLHPDFQPELDFDPIAGAVRDALLALPRESYGPEPGLRLNEDLREIKNRLIAASRNTNGSLAVTLRAAALAVAKALIDEGVEG